MAELWGTELQGTAREIDVYRGFVGCLEGLELGFASNGLATTGEVMEESGELQVLGIMKWMFVR